VAKALEDEGEVSSARIEAMTDEMLMAAAALDFEKAARIRDQIKVLTGGSRLAPRRSNRSRSAKRRR
jgi:excinuclease UvrABC nuclease subunit